VDLDVVEDDAAITVAWAPTDALQELLADSGGSLITTELALAADMQVSRSDVVRALDRLTLKSDVTVEHRADGTVVLGCDWFDRLSPA
jgi:hypothetical protein